MDYLAHVTKDIKDLIPEFLANREREPDALEAAVLMVDFPRLQHLGERMYALGNPYGFRQITTFGRTIREATAAEDVKAVENVISEYRDYLTKVQIVEVDAPVPRRLWNKQASNDDEMWGGGVNLATPPSQVGRSGQR